jgi:hypothetical protein
MKYTIYKNDVGQLMAMEGHCEFDGVISKCVDMSVSMEFFVEACARKQWEPQWFNETAVYTTGYNQAVDEINALKAENARLRVALESISGIYNDEDEPSKGYAGNIAREALKGGE